MQEDYKSYFTPEGFKPSQLNKGLQGLDRNAERMSASLQSNANMIRLNNQIRERNAVNDAKILSEAAAFSKSALDITQKVIEQNVENQKVEETYEALTGGYDPDTDTQAIQEEEQEEQLKDGVVRISQTLEYENEPAAAEVVRSETPAGLVANQNMSERARLMRAQVSYPSWMTAFLRSDAQFTLNGESYNVAQAMMSGNGALMAAAQGYARSQFISQYGLQNVSKRRFVKTLKGTILNADASISAGFMSESVRAKRAEKQREYTELGFQVGASGVVDIGGEWRTLADLMYDSGAYTTRGMANEAALKSVLAGLESKGDVEGIRRLERENKIQGNDGTKLGGQYSSIFYDAEQKAETRRQGIIDQNNKDIKAGMYEELSQLGTDATPEQRSAVVERAAVALEANGDFEEARNLRQKQEDLRVDANSDLNAAQLQQGIQDGSVTATDISEARLRGDITASQETTLNSELKAEQSTADPDDKEAKDVVKDWSARFNADFLAAVGLKRDPQGIIVKGKYPLLSPGEAKIVTGQMKRDLNAVVNGVLAINPGITGSAKTKLINSTVQEWWRSNVENSTGKYYYLDIQEGNRRLEGLDEKGRADRQRKKERFTNLVTDPAARLRQSIPNALEPLDFSSYGRSGKPISDELVKLWNPLRGDKLFDEDDLLEIREAWQNGQIDPRLTQFGGQLRMSPLELLNQQSRSYRLSPFSYETNRSSNAAPNLPAPADGLAGAQYLMTRGFPKRSAAYLAGNIQQESGWYGQRMPWDDVGAPAGGLVSWRAGRLNAIEAFYGKSISQITNDEQIAYMIQEMRDKYQDAYRVFMNPYATPRQLQDASFRYWGYGEAGGRYTFAEQYFQQL